MEEINGFITNFAIFSDRFRPDPILKVKIEEDDLSILQINRFKISVGSLDAATIVEIRNFIDTDGISVRFHDKILNEPCDLDSELTNIKSLDYSSQFEISVTIKFDQHFKIPLVHPTTFICIMNNLKEFVKELVNTLKINMIVHQQYKINIYSSNKNVYKSSVFNFVNHDSQMKFEILDEFISNSMLYTCYLNILPNVFPFNDDTFKYTASLAMFELFADKKNQDELIFIKKNPLLVNMKNIDSSFKDNYSKLSELINFVYSDNKGAVIKLNVAKNLIYDYLSHSKDINGMDIDFWTGIIEESELEYKLYINDEITNFINDKKEVLKEQFEISYQIANKANQMKKNVMSNVVYIIGIFLSDFLIENLKNDEVGFNQLAFWLSLILSSFIILSFYMNGENKYHESYISKIRLINEHYPKLYIIKENIVNDLEEKISTPEINKLKRTEKFAEVVYWGIFLIAFAGVIFMNFNYLEKLYDILKFFNNLIIQIFKFTYLRF